MVDSSALVEVEASLNGHEEEAGASPASTAHAAHVDIQRGVFVTSRGNEIELSGKHVSALMLERLVNEGKPKIPMKEVLILGKHKQMEANANDPSYLALLAEWQTSQKISTLIYVFTIGVKGNPDAEFIDDQASFFPNANATDMKYLWVCSQLPDEDIDKLAEAIIGQGSPTAKGLDEAANFTPSSPTETP